MRSRMSAFGGKTDIDQPRLPISIYEYTARHRLAHATRLAKFLVLEQLSLHQRVVTPRVRDRHVQTRQRLCGFVPCPRDRPEAVISKPSQLSPSRVRARQCDPTLSQLFLDVTTWTWPGTTETFLLPHFGHFDFATSCSEIASVRSKVVSHSLQRYV